MTELEPVVWRWAWKTTGSELEQRFADPDLYEWTYRDTPPSEGAAPKMDVQPLVTLSSAQSAIAERDARIAELDEEIGRLEDENSDLRCEPWPDWARAVLKVIRKHSGYDGYDDATEGVDMPLELSEHLSEMEAEAGRWKARAEAAEALMKEAFLRGFMSSAEGYNGEYPFDMDDDCLSDPKWVEMRDRVLSAMKEKP